MTDATYPRIRLAKLNAHWPSSEPPFDRATGEFSKWSTKLEIFLQQSGLDHYIFASARNPSRLITSPDESTEPNAYANWLSNNGLIIGVIRAAISEAEQEGLETDGTAKEYYDALKARAQREGPVKQVALVREALSTYAPVAEPIETTARKICDLVDRAFSIGAIDKDLLKCIAEALPTQQEMRRTRLPTSVNCSKPLTASPHSLKALATLPWLLAILNAAPTPMTLDSLAVPTATHLGFLAADTPNNGASGRVVGWPVRQLTNPRRHARQREEEDAKEESHQTRTRHLVDLSHLQKIQLETTKPTDFAGITDSNANNTTDYFEYEGFMADDSVDPTEYEPRASVNWDTHTMPAIPSHETILATTAVLPSNPSDETRLISLTEKPFYMDSGATVHISPCAADFVTLRPIPPRAVKGVGGTSISRTCSTSLLPQYASSPSQHSPSGCAQ